MRNLNWKITDKPPQLPRIMKSLTSRWRNVLNYLDVNCNFLSMMVGSIETTPYQISKILNTCFYPKPEVAYFDVIKVRHRLWSKAVIGDVIRMISKSRVTPYQISNLEDSLIQDSIRSSLFWFYQRQTQTKIENSFETVIGETTWMISKTWGNTISSPDVLTYD